jgi:hypothetical protein
VRCGEIKGVTNPVITATSGNQVGDAADPEVGPRPKIHPLVNLNVGGPTQLTESEIDLLESTNQQFQSRLENLARPLLVERAAGHTTTW